MKKAEANRHKAQGTSVDALRAGNFHLISRRLFTFTFCLLTFVFMHSACGKRRPPLPPVERVPQRTELLSGVQRGNQVILSWPAPAP